MRIASTLIMLTCLTVTHAQAQVVAVGTSFTRGWVAPSEAWPAQLEGLLRAKGVNVSVTNEGVNGDTSYGMLGRLDSAVPNGTRVVILNCCPTDNRAPGLTVQDPDANVTQMVTKLRARGIHVVFIGPPEEAAVASRAGAHWCRRIRKGVAAEHFVGRKPGLIHPDAEGNAIIAGNILPCVTAALNSKR
jgi:acyl-CoA thioesterase-1